MLNKYLLKHMGNTYPCNSIEEADLIKARLIIQCSHHLENEHQILEALANGNIPLAEQLHNEPFELIDNFKLSLDIIKTQALHRLNE